MAHRQKNGKLERSESRETAHDWEGEQQSHKDFYDDGTKSFFWRAHTITVLVIFSCVLVYVAIFEEPSDDPEFNTKRGITACVLAFLTFSITQTPDGPFLRPHPAFWRMTLCLSIIYELFLIFLLFQTVHDSRQLMKYFDEDLGEPLPEKSYGGNCLLYDSNNPADPFHNIWDKTDVFVPSHFAGWYFKDKMDGFVTIHFFGWWLKTLILRDYWLCTVLSVMFEVLEYTLEHQLPNFSECWWDHWIMDALVCNGLGIYFGMLTLQYLSMKPYHWRGIWNCPSYTDKLRRVAAQFTPYSWTDFDWKPTESLKRWLGMLGVIAVFLLAELNTFYLKFVLWIPPPHFLCLGRLVLLLCWGAVAMRETFQYMDDPQCKRFGRQSWVIAVIIITELLIIIRFDYETVTRPVPSSILYFWIIGFIILASWTIWNFYLKRHPAWFLLIENTVSSVAHRFSGILRLGKHDGQHETDTSNGLQNGSPDSGYNTRSKNRRKRHTVNH